MPHHSKIIVILRAFKRRRWQRPFVEVRYRHLSGDISRPFICLRMYSEMPRSLVSRIVAHGSSG